MKASSFSVPVNLLLRDEARLFAAALAALQCPNPPAVIALLWIDWGTQERVWRPLRHPVPGSGFRVPGSEFRPATLHDATLHDATIHDATLHDATLHDATLHDATLHDATLPALPVHDPTFQLIELAAGWTLAKGAMARAALESGYLRLVKQGDASGVELANFAELNPQFVPGFKTMHQKGADASTIARRRKHDGVAAQQQRELLDRQSALPFAADAAEVENAMLLIMQLDRIANRKPRTTKEYELALLEKTVFIQRNFTPGRIESFQQWLVHKRGDASVAQGAELVIMNWDEYLERSGL